MTDNEIKPQMDNRSTVLMCLEVAEGDPFMVLRAIERGEAEVRARRISKAQRPTMAQVLAEYADQKRILLELHPEVAESTKGDPGE